MDTLANAGTEKSMLDIIGHFSNDVEAKVVYFYPGDDLKEAYEKAGIPLIFVNLPGKRSWFKGISSLRKIIREEKPDVVVSSILRANIISRIACWLSKTKLVGTFVSDSYSSMRTNSFSSKRKAGFYFFYRLDRLTAGIPVAWISNSNCIKASNCKYLGVDPDKVKVIYRGREAAKFPAKDNNRSKDNFHFVYVARLLQTKGLQELVEAFRKVAEKYPHAILDVYGDGPYRNSLKESIQRYGLNEKIKQHGKVPDGWKKLYEADCFVFPSWYEGFSGSLVEAMMVGIPIIASDIPMNLEAVTRDKTARVHEVKNAESLATEMENAIAGYDEMKQMATNARKEAIERFDISVIAAQYENYLKEAIAK